jgi:periplasmic protein TonB
VLISSEAFPLPAEHTFERRRLAAFIAASLALHAFAIVGLPDFMRDAAVPPLTVLEVTLVTPGSPPVAPSEAPPLLPQAKQDPAPPTNVARETTRSAVVPPQPVADLPPSSFTVAPSRLPETAAVAVDPRVQAANAVLTPPNFDAKYLNNPAPAYPQVSRRAGEQGTVMLRVMVRRDGLPTSVEIEKSSGSRNLDAAAREAVWGWRFVPATLGADPIESWVLVPVVFRLDGAS